jgi:hypothetical protein
MTDRAIVLRKLSALREHAGRLRAGARREPRICATTRTCRTRCR